MKTNEEIAATEFKIVQGKFPWELKPGEAMQVQQEDKVGLIFCCPNCGKSASSDHTWVPETQTLSPSIIHEECGWHGFLRDGKFSTA